MRPLRDDVDGRKETWYFFLFFMFLNDKSFIQEVNYDRFNQITLRQYIFNNFYSHHRRKYRNIEAFVYLKHSEANFGHRLKFNIGNSCTQTGIENGPNWSMVLT